MKNMRLSELKNTDVVLSTKGSYGIVLKDTPRGDIIKWFLNKNGELKELRHNLLHLAKSLIEYSNSAIGIIDGIASRYDDKTDVFTQLKDQLKDKEALEMVKDLLEKL